MLAGHDSRGIGMVPRYVTSLLDGELKLNQVVSIAQDAGTLVTIDGKRGMGQSVAPGDGDRDRPRARTGSA